MSFILDALRKSEHARGSRALPGLIDVPVSRSAPSRLPWILAGVGALLVINLAVLVWVLARPSPRTEPPAAPAAPAARAVAPTPASAAVVPRPVAPRVRPLAAETEPGPDPELEHVEAAAAAPRAAPPAPLPYAAERAAAAREFRPGVSVAGLPSIHDLPPQATAGLPALNIDLHVYSAEPAQRFVIINGQRLHEGGQLKEGPAVERITPDGAILNHQGTRFLLPRE